MDTKKLNIYQIENGYCYNSDSLFFYGFIKSFLKNNISLLDIGAGSGILGLLCARDFNIKLTLNDINTAMVKLCYKNAIENDIMCEVIHYDILESNLGKFDFIISNPPFYNTDSINPKTKHLYLAKKSENLPLQSLCGFVKKSLKQNGKFIFCYAAKEIKNVFNCLNAFNLNVDNMKFIHPKENRDANLMMLQCSFSKNKTKILPPLYNFIGNENSKEAREIFKLCNTNSIKMQEGKL